MRGGCSASAMLSIKRQDFLALNYMYEVATHLKSVASLIQGSGEGGSGGSGVVVSLEIRAVAWSRHSMDTLGTGKECLAFTG